MGYLYCDSLKYFFYKVFKKFGSNEIRFGFLNPNLEFKYFKWIKRWKKKFH